MLHAHFLGRSTFVLAMLLLFGSEVLAQTSLPVANPPAELAVERVLMARTSLSWGGGTLTECADLLGSQFELNVRVDERALDDVGLGVDTPLKTSSFKGVTLQAALTLMLEQLGLTFVVRDGVLVITTPEQAANHLKTRVYPVADLVAPLQTVVAGEAYQWDDYDTLMETVTSTIHPDTWDDVGGAATIEPFPPSRSLVISQTRAAHLQIESLLETLRQVAGGRASSPAAPASGVEMVGSVPYRRPVSAARGRGWPRSQEQGGFF